MDPIFADAHDPNADPTNTDKTMIGSVRFQDEPDCCSAENSI